MPVPARVAVAQVRLAHKFSIRNIHQIVGHRHTDVHRFSTSSRHWSLFGHHMLAPDLFARRVDPHMPRGSFLKVIPPKRPVSGGCPE